MSVDPLLIGTFNEDASEYGAKFVCGHIVVEDRKVFHAAVQERWKLIKSTLIEALDMVDFEHSDTWTSQQMLYKMLATIAGKKSVHDTIKVVEAWKYADNN